MVGLPGPFWKSREYWGIDVRSEAGIILDLCFPRLPQADGVASERKPSPMDVRKSSDSKTPVKRQALQMNPIISTRLIGPGEQIDILLAEVGKMWNKMPNNLRDAVVLKCRLVKHSA